MTHNLLEINCGETNLSKGSEYLRYEVYIYIAPDHSVGLGVKRLDIDERSEWSPGVPVRVVALFAAADIIFMADTYPDQNAFELAYQRALELQGARYPRGLVQSKLDTILQKLTVLGVLVQYDELCDLPDTYMSQAVLSAMRLHDVTVKRTRERNSVLDMPLPDNKSLGSYLSAWGITSITLEDGSEVLTTEIDGLLKEVWFNFFDKREGFGRILFWRNSPTDELQAPEVPADGFNYVILEAQYDPDADSISVLVKTNLPEEPEFYARPIPVWYLRKLAPPPRKSWLKRLFGHKRK